MAEAADGFEDAEETTSPQVFRGLGRNYYKASIGKNPLALVGSRSAPTRNRICELLQMDGWMTVPVCNTEELLDIHRQRHPHIIIVDDTIAVSDGTPIPELVRGNRATDPVRFLKSLSGGTDHVAEAVADGFDDFIIDETNDIELLARAASNLRACRSIATLQKQQRDAASLLELSQALASSLDMQLILHTVSRLIAQVVDFERCSIVVLDPESDEGVMVAASEDRHIRDLRINLANYPELGRCVQTAAPVLIEDTAVDSSLAGVKEHLVNAGVRAMALFPIIFEERVTGVLFLRSSQAGRLFADDEVQFGQTVASTCAVAIRNARLFDSFRDQTERMNYMRIVAERQMEATKKYEDFFEYAADGMAIVDADATIHYVNKEGRTLLGYPNDNLRSRSFLDFLVDESRERWPEIVDQVRLGRHQRSFDLYVSDPQGTEHIFWLSAGGVGQETGLLVLSFRDVTETREMELELRTTKEFLENLIDNSVDAIVAADMGGNLMLFNKGAERLYGYTAEDVIGRLHVGDLYPPGVARETMRQLRNDRHGGKGRLEEQRKTIFDSSGVAIPVSMTASIIYEDGEEVATVGVMGDMRERVKIEQRLADAQGELLMSEKARVAAQLAGMAAHELNQPLTSVMGYAEMLRHRIDESDRRRRSVDIIFEQAERMAKIVHKIGRITKYETKAYGASTTILDLNRATTSEGEDTDKKHRPKTNAFVSLMAKKKSSGPVIREDTIDRKGTGRTERVTGKIFLGNDDDLEVTGPIRRAPSPKVDEKTDPGL